MMIKAAIEKVAVQNADGSLSIGRQALRDALYATKDFKGLTGNLTCTPTGDCADPHIAAYVYHTGEYPPEKIWP
jgi:branched-chain amino acid transport system substrate-binding protein